jgi:glyoxylase-like metal-dependent hydrolase (beta-lactamase superfamily II)
MDTDLPEHVHALPLELEYKGRDLTLDPCAVETGRGLLLFDVGPAGSLGVLESALADAGFDLGDVATVLLTHQDADHAGALSAVRERTDAMAVASERAAAVITGREPPRGSDPDDDRYPPARVDLELEAGATFDTLAGPARVVPTPGHTPGHVSVFFPEAGFLVAADALTADEDGLQGPSPEMSEEMDVALESAGRLAELDVERVLCYHGGFVDAGNDRIAEVVRSARP